MQYTNFSKYVLRTPLLPLNFFLELTKDTILTQDDLKKICQESHIKEALFLASPSLYTAFEKWLDGQVNAVDSERMTYSILKYLSRMSSRCTPFGLFAGTAVGAFGESTDIVLKKSVANKRHTRLDMNYLVALSQDIVKDESIRKQLRFYPNTSIYKAGAQLRYVEYHYENSRRMHHIVGVQDSEYLQKVLDAASAGATLETLAQCLVDDEITLEVASGFIEELVGSQLLVSELEPSVSGPEFTDQIIPILKKLKGTSQLVEKLEDTQQKIKKLDAKIGNPSTDYIAISESLETLQTGFELKYLFQTDMSLHPQKNVLNKQLIYKIRRAMRLLNKISQAPSETLLSQFRKAFYERYEDREVPLSQALDVELGVGFLQNKDSGDVSALVDDIMLPGRSSKITTKEVKWNTIHSILHEKLLSCLRKNEQVVTLQDADFDKFEEKWTDLPDTISAMVEVITIAGEEHIIMSNAGGSSAANLLGRFCHSDPEIHNYVKEIIAVEERCNPNKILAEIVHLPESRVGNILMRPALRDYEIPYLAKSVLNTDAQLPIDDLMISVKRDHVILRSKKYNKEVIPHLSNAHNYSSGALPIYQFLANMQSQNKRGGVGFYWGPFEGDFPFLPRVVYKGVVLASKTWNILKSDIEELQNSLKNMGNFQDNLELFIKEKQLPQYVLLKDNDNELLINLKNVTSVQMLLSTVKKRPRFILKEFLHNEQSIASGTDASYTNQVIISFYNETLLKQQSDA
ncbi:lantibiotic dehydratase family protein [uncultured Dokdonia sp.]|uniref:lantibiotic dehydratase family protein n=1 Tax=uncultured Dokdonia sp. TaxID=575653 RepID=UPI00260F8AD1|nr:lantibiotic dehydratase family protein [uncultured Dokdonia sp.]